MLKDIKRRIVELVGPALGKKLTKAKKLSRQVLRIMLSRAPKTVQPDMCLDMAAAYIVLETATPLRNGFPGACRDHAMGLLHKAVDAGIICVWGHKRHESMDASYYSKFNDVKEAIPVEYWADNDFDYAYFLQETEHTQYKNLTVSRLQVMNTWKRRSFLALLMDMRRDPRLPANGNMYGLLSERILPPQEVLDEYFSREGSRGPAYRRDEGYTQY
jgi:hypothetical protein